MGNCIHVLLSSPQKKSKVLIIDGVEEEFKALTLVEKAPLAPYKGHKLVHRAQSDSPLPPKAKLKSGEVNYLVPHLGRPCNPPFLRKVVVGNSCRGWKVKIVVTKEQLELMMSSVECQSRNVAIQSLLGRKECQKWRPSLATIPE
ncbi:hypothetical protein TEA_022812 [Camellia sinensis var. sinensis]|uniref:Uncharacterized protein n=1 Tax=Camellia sinensis var. sinensis TaxID=542762 RepID=A0A4S4EDF7_CAMSN|nr:hypothetical protein TEA_022812 [Camellia sinensis var. sinensis]